MLVKRRAKFLPRLRERLSQRVCLKGESIPFFLESAQESRDGCEGRRPGSDDTRGL